MAEKSKRGFAAMDREKQRAIASKGGKAAHQKGTAHEFTREEARLAGQKSRRGRQKTNANGAAGNGATAGTNLGTQGNTNPEAMTATPNTGQAMPQGNNPGGGQTGIPQTAATQTTGEVQERRPEQQSVGP